MALIQVSELLLFAQIATVSQSSRRVAEKSCKEAERADCAKRKRNIDLDIQMRAHRTILLKFAIVETLKDSP